jgi:uncharacterized membrane protein YphA (DoxX/SURF4 family)
MQRIERYIPWTIRILIAGLFIISAYSKIYPEPSAYGSITLFEVKKLYPLGFSVVFAKIFSRSLIGVELALGLFLLLPFDLKKWVIPALITILAAFILHLSFEIYTTGNKGNCGCFGALLPMTPLEAILKNAISICLLALLGIRYSRQIPGRSNTWFLTTILTLCILLIFIFIPTNKYVPVLSPGPEPVLVPIDAPITDSAEISNPSNYPKSIEKYPSKAKTIIDVGPKPIKSGYEKCFVQVNEGKKILCFFSPNCEHCRNTAKEITTLKNGSLDFPEIQIIFMDEAAEEIPNFFSFIGASYPYVVLDIIEFWKVFGGNHDVPGVVYLWNGNMVKFYHGSAPTSAFNKEDLKTLLQKKN